MEDILIIKNDIGIEIFDKGAKLIILFKDKPHLKDLDDNIILDMYLVKTL